jgi:hypothetical protein
MNRVPKTFLFILTIQSAFNIAVKGQVTSSLDHDKRQIDSCIKNLYRFLSYTNGKTENVDSLSSLFIPDGKLTANFGDQPKTWSVQQFIEFVKDGYTKQSITDREEIELFEKTEIFGKISQRISTYKINFLINEKIEQRRGINSIQLLKINEKWLINSLIWDTEKLSLKIPDIYLKQ